MVPSEATRLISYMTVVHRAQLHWTYILHALLTDDTATAIQAYVPGLQQVGRIHVAAFSDANLYAEVANKSFFWMQPNFYGIDLTCLQKDAAAGYFTQVCSCCCAGV